MSFLKEINKLKNKVEILVELNKSIPGLEIKRVELNKEIFRIYQILFKNFVSSKIETPIVLETDKEYGGYCKKKVCLNEYGFSLIYNKSNKKSMYVNETIVLIKIFNRYKDLLPFVKNKQKKKLINKFGRILRLLKSESEMIIEKNFDKSKEIKCCDFLDLGELKEFNQIWFFGEHINFKDTNGIRKGYSLLLSSIQLFDFFLIEQHYLLIKNLLIEYEKKSNKHIKSIEKVLELLKKEFSSELILDKLK